MKTSAATIPAITINIPNIADLILFPKATCSDGGRFGGRRHWD
jgi:hypothetical protein